MNELLDELKGLGVHIEDFVKERDTSVWKLRSIQQSIWAGNPEAKIMVAQMNPDATEINWCENNNTDIGYVCHNPSGTLFKKTVERSGFHPMKDFFYCNIVPFTRIGFSKFDRKTVRDFLWIFDSLVEKIQPKIIIALGIEAFSAIVNQDVANPVFQRMVKQGAILQMDDFEVIPLEDLSVIESSNSLRNKSFFQTIRRLYVTTHNLRNHGKSQ